MKQICRTIHKTMRNLIIVLLLLSGCVPSYLVSRPELMYNNERGFRPFLNDTSKAGIDDTIYTEYDYRINPAVELNRDLETRYASVPGNVKLVKVLKDGKEAYASISLSGRSITYLADNSNNGKFDHIMVQARENPTNWKSFSPEAPYRQVEGIRSETGGYELILTYRGLSDDELTISYRAYRDDLTRAAAIQQFTFSTEMDTLDIHGARIELISLSPDTLSYRMLSGFPDQMKQ